MNAYAIECRTCGEPSDSRICPECREARERFNGAVRTLRNQDEQHNGSSNGR